MRCEVLLFAQLRQAIGRDCLTIDLPDNATVGCALDALAEQYSSIKAMRSTIAVAVNERYRSHDAQLSEGNTIALIPPVSGG